MSSQERIYLDNAATSWPKPQSVYDAVDQYQRTVGAAAGRSFYREAVEVDRMLQRTRTAIARLIGAKESSRIVFTFNGTDSLNLALHGILQSGDHVITSAAEHNSVLRPLRYLERHQGVEVSQIPVDAFGFVDPDTVRRAIRPNSRLVALIHASNVTGALQPAEDVGRIAHENDLLFLLDAAQSLGHFPLDVTRLHVDLLTAPGHKGLLGPLGTGVLYVAPDVEEQLRPIRQGGTGTDSESDQQPQTLPEKYESGNHNVAGLVGLSAGVEYVAQQGVANVHQHELQLVDRLLQVLGSVGNVTLYGPSELPSRVGVVSFTIGGYDPQELAAMLDASANIQVRPGLHCAPGMHHSLGTLNGGGTLRISCGAFNSLEQIDLTAKTIVELARVHP